MASPPPRPVVLLIGALRVIGVVTILVVAVAVIVPAALVPGGVGWAERAAVVVARALLAVMGVRLRVEGARALRRHRGFVFFSHPSFLDPLALVAVRPLRFLAAAGVRRLPLLGPVATALGTLYLDRGRDDDRRRSRRALREAVASSVTPVALAPEGGIWPGPGLGPLRRGAFEVAAEAGAPVLLVAIGVEPHAAARWGEGEPLVIPIWRVCARTTPLTVTVRALHPALDARRADAATEAERRLRAALADRPARQRAGRAAVA